MDRELDLTSTYTKMDPWWLRILKSTPMVALGIVTFSLLFGKSEEPMVLELGKGCPQKSLYTWRSGVNPLDQFLCVLVTFFTQAVSSSEGQWVTGYTLSLFSSALAFMGVEGSRVKSAWVLSLTPLFAIFSQAIGVSVTVPLLWLPIYFLYDSGNRDVEHVWKRKMSLVRVAAIAFFLLFEVTLKSYKPLNPTSFGSLIWASHTYWILMLCNVNMHSGVALWEIGIGCCFGRLHFLTPSNLDRV